jgi:hypothetical protein
MTQLWLSILTGCAILWVIAVSIGVMLGILGPAEAFRRVCVGVAILVLLIVAPTIAVASWVMMSIWQKLGTAVLAFFAVAAYTRMRTPRSKPRGTKY